MNIESLLNEAYLAGFLDAEDSYKVKNSWRASVVHPSTNPYWQSRCNDAVKRLLEPGYIGIFQVGDIVEHWTSEHHWRYWTTIQTQEDAESADALDKTFYRVVRAIRTYSGLIKVLVNAAKKQLTWVVL